MSYIYMVSQIKPLEYFFSGSTVEDFFVIKETDGF